VFEIVMYSRTTSCPFVTLAKRVLDDNGLPYREIYIDRDDEAKKRVLEWTGFLAVPTIVVAWTGDQTPISAPDYLERGRSPRFASSTACRPVPHPTSSTRIPGARRRCSIIKSTSASVAFTNDSSM
jgi:glutaredoxin